MTTKLYTVRLLWVPLFCSLVLALHGQNLEKEVRGMLKDALGGSRDAVVVNDSNQKLQLRLDGKRCIVNGGSNLISIGGECAELVVNGIGNKIRVERLAAVRVLGANNLVTYDRGVSSSKPDSIRILGAGSAVVRSGNEAKGDTSTSAESSRMENPAAGASVTIGANNNLHLIRSIRDKTPVLLSGNNNSVEISGSASNLTISGNNNLISVDGVEEILFKGNDNLVFYKNGENPQTTSSGLNNIVKRR
jgi:hypothetical protein